MAKKYILINEYWLNKTKQLNNKRWRIQQQEQIFKSQLDLSFHCGSLKVEGGDCDRHILQIIEETREKILPHLDCAGMAWDARTAHFVGYGGFYYGYLYSHHLASDLWDTCFQKNPLCLEMGTKYREKVLSYGGMKAPALLMNDMLEGNSMKLFFE